MTMIRDEPASTGGLSEKLAIGLDAIAQGDHSPEAAASAKTRLLHAVRVALTSRDLPAAELAWNATGTNSGNCVVIGRAERLSGPDAAFVNGVTSHSSLKEDCGPGGLREGSHPGTYVIPAALAAADMANSSGSALLRGVIAGYEAVGRIGAASPPGIGLRRFRPVGVMGPFGAAAAAAAVWNLGPAATSRTLAIAANMAAGTNQGIYEGTMEPYFHAGVSARNGILAAQLAAAGAVTSHQSLEGEFGFFETYGGEQGATDEVTVERDEYAVSRVGTKRFAACMQNQQTLALIIDTAPADLNVGDIVGVTIRRPATGTNGLGSPGVSRIPPYSNMLQAQMSARFTAAAALAGAPVEDPTYFRNSYADSAITALARKITLDNSTDGSVAVEIKLPDRVIVLDSDMSSTLFPSAEEIRDRFLRDVGASEGFAHAGKLAALIDDLDQLTLATQLTDALCMPRVP
ncbi:MmgE/PrpD family protein [Rhodococcus wratislaviensis]|uniref:MmgE/PrpD family protein n=1 Tax=Rhodococcus wratislaviensis TaxID=44752 RepID=A0A402CM83_RHOWR|nr:MmgE/PrpD family protein [Rhodococcus wratislaviensis]GCE44608.1 MmgE/PrpD family protein [Rhodococcus wratislaviensis]